jgi:hypothetical protein
MLMVISTQALSQGTKLYWGEGGAPCSRWTKEHQQEKTVTGTQLAAWVRGYVSGANVMQIFTNSNIFELTEVDAMEVWINDYCLSHPEDKLVAGADALVASLMARAMRK